MLVLKLIIKLKYKLEILVLGNSPVVVLSC